MSAISGRQALGGEPLALAVGGARRAGHPPVGVLAVQLAGGDALAGRRVVADGQAVLGLDGLRQAAVPPALGRGLWVVQHLMGGLVDDVDLAVVQHVVHVLDVLEMGGGRHVHPPQQIAGQLAVDQRDAEHRRHLGLRPASVSAAGPPTWPSARPKSAAVSCPLARPSLTIRAACSTGATTALRAAPCTPLLTGCTGCWSRRTPRRSHRRRRRSRTAAVLARDQAGLQVGEADILAGADVDRGPSVRRGRAAGCRSSSGARQTPAGRAGRGTARTRGRPGCPGS